MDNLCFTLSDFRADGILADRIILGNFVKGNCRIPTLNFVDSSEDAFFVYVKDIEYDYLYKKCIEIQENFGFDIEKIKAYTSIAIYNDFRSRPIICSNRKQEFYTLDIEYLGIQNIDSIC